MRTRFYIGIAMLALATLAPFAETAAQKMPERRLVRKGNRQFGRERYDKSIDSYTRALEAAPTSFEAAYDLANAMFRAERYDTAEQTLKGIVADSTRSDIDRSEAVYNLGNTQFAQQKLKEALASYRAAMRLNPDDQEAKYNYAYTKHLLQQQEQQQQNDQNKDDQNQDQDQNKDNQQNQQNQQNGQDDKQQDGSQNDPQQGDGDRNQQQGDEGDRNEGEGQPQPQSGISEQEREAMLEAIQAQEDKTQDKLKEKTGVLVRGRKNW